MDRMRTIADADRDEQEKNTLAAVEKLARIEQLEKEGIARKRSNHIKELE